MHAFAATSCSPTHIDIFYLEPGFTMAHKMWDGSQWRVGWDEMGGEFSTVPAAVVSRARRPPPGPIGPGGVVHGGAATRASAARTAEIVILNCRTDVFAVGTDYAMYHQTVWDGTPTPGAQWESLGGIFTSTPAAVVWQGNRVEVFGLGTDRAMYRKSWNGAAWSPTWERLGGTFSSQASVVSVNPGRLDVFVRGADYTLRHRAFDSQGPTNDWQNLGGSLASEPVAVVRDANHVDVFAIGYDGMLMHRWFDGEFWNDWESLGGNYCAAPSAISFAPDRLDVFATGIDHSVYHYWWTEETWFGPEIFEGKIRGAPTAISVEPGKMHVLAPGSDSELYTKAFDGTQWSPVLWDMLGDKVTLPTWYRFSVDYVKVDTARSFDHDTDTCQMTVAAGNWPVQSVTQSTGDIGGTNFSVSQTNLLNLTLPLEMCEPVTWNYIVINNGHADQTTLDSIIVTAGSALLSAGVKALSGSSILGAVAGFLLTELGSFLFQDCDGIVAVEQGEFSGRELRLKTVAHELSQVVTDHAGTDSPTGCGSNSEYEVTWSIGGTG